MGHMLTEPKNNQRISQATAACLLNIFILNDGISRLFFARFFPSQNTFFNFSSDYFTNNYN